MLQHTTVTTENLELVRDQMSVVDQGAKLEPGCETWGFLYGGGQRGQITVWPHKGRAAICHGGDSVWGSWDPNARAIIADELDDDGRAVVYGEGGEQITADEE
jgi:hypothetical protein